MTLSRKTLLVLATASAVSILLSYVVLRATVYTTFIELEKNSATDDTNRVEAAVQSQLDSLVVLNTEYSAWDDTYEYMQEQDEDYISKNINAETLENLDLDSVTLLDTQGQLVFGIERDSSGAAVIQSNHPFAERDAIRDKVSVSKATSSKLVGIVDDSLGQLLIVSLPVLQSDGQGPPAGSLVFGRILTEARLQRLRDQFSVEFSFIPTTSERLTSDLRRALESLGTASTDLPQALEPDRILSYRPVRDILGKPVFVLEVAAARQISHAGGKAVAIALAFLAATGILYLLVSTLSLKQLIISPVSELTRHIGHLRESGDLSRRISSTRNDEMGMLTNRVDSLVAALDTAQNEMAATRDKALEASKAKSQFLANMSHEIRTPINGVLGMTELLLSSTNLDEQQHRYAKMAHQSGDSLLSIINDILDFSKIEAGKLELDIAPFDLRNVVEESLELLAERAHGKRLELVGDIALGTHTYVQGDPARLRQILTNLIGNAVKFTEQGEIIVRLTEPQDASDTAVYRFEVQDTGVGIDAKNTNTIFESFCQEDSSTTRRFGGTGLGLSISKQLIELMGGEIGVDSTLGKGSTFWFTAHLAKDEATSSYLQPDVLTGTRVLIVDDNATNREILRHQLEGWRVQVAEASSGSEALWRLSQTRNAEEPFDVVLLDMHMPEMDGLEVARVIRQDPDFRHLSLVMLSSVSTAGSSLDRKQSGLDAWLTKPIRQTRLHEALASVMASAILERTSDGLQAGLRESELVCNENSLRILLVEDNSVNQAVAEGMLSALGHHTTTATNGREALLAFQAEVFDLVLMDCNMPEMDGFEATQAIRQWEKDRHCSRTRVIALTANALTGDRERCLEAGMDDYLSKPFTIEQLRNVSTSHMLDRMAAETRGSGLRSHCESDELATTGSTTVSRLHGIDAEDSSHEHQRILVVEDNRVNQEITRAMLKSLGYETKSAVDGNEALRAMSLESFDLILMDCHMPGLDGYETTEAIRRRERCSSCTQRIPIVAVTADFLEGNRQRCLDCGMDDYMTKPFTQAQLRQILTKWLTDSGDEKSTQPTSTTDGRSILGEGSRIASINRQALEEIRQLDPDNGDDLLREIVVTFCASSAKLMVQLRSALSDGDADALGHIAHSLKGASSQIGATLLASLCEQLVSTARNDALSNAPILVEQAAIEHFAVIDALDKEVQSAAA